MTGAEHLAQILAYIDSAIPDGPDPATRLTNCTIGIASAILVRAENLIAASQFDVACDLITLGRQFSDEAYKVMIEDRRAAGKPSLLEAFQRLSDASRSDVTFHENGASPTSDSGAIPADELVRLGVIADVAEVGPPSQRFSIVGVAPQTRGCHICEAEARATFFAIEVGEYNVRGASLCDAHLQEYMDILHADPEMRQVAQIVFVRVDRPDSPPP